MMKSLVITLFVAVAGLAGCTQPQLVDPSHARTYRISDVRVEGAVAATRQGRGFNSSEVQLERTYDSGISAVIINGANRNSVRPVIIDVAVTTVFLSNPAAALLVGGSSNTTATVRLFDERSGQLLEGPFELGGVDANASGIVGAVIIAGRGEQRQLASLAQSLGLNIRNAIFGEQATGL